MGGDAAMTRHPSDEMQSYETMRPMPRKAGIRCPLPKFVEWALVGSRSFLFDSL
jgi:hypothetical protein